MTDSDILTMVFLVFLVDLCVMPEHFLLLSFATHICIGGNHAPRPASELALLVSGEKSQMTTHVFFIGPLRNSLSRVGF